MPQFQGPRDGIIPSLFGGLLCRPTPGLGFFIASPTTDSSGSGIVLSLRDFILKASSLTRFYSLRSLDAPGMALGSSGRPRSQPERFPLQTNCEHGKKEGKFFYLDSEWI